MDRRIKLFSTYLPLAALVLMLFYVGIRSYTVDITADEAWSFHNVKKFWYAETLCTGNTHWLNSAAIKAALLFHLERNWQIRWFSTLSAIVYGILCFLWIRTLDKIYFRFFACLLLMFNPYVLDFFGLARGYASGLMFESLSLFLFVINLKKNKRSIAFSALICAGLSAIANFSFVYYLAAYAMVHFYTFYFTSGIRCLKNKNFYSDLFLTLGFSFLVMRAFIFMLRCTSDVLGAGTDKITEVCPSLLEGLLYSLFNLGNPGSTFVSVFLTFLITSVCIYGIYKHKKHQNSVFLYSSLLLSIMFLLISINYFVFKVELPFGRSALFLFPFVCINLICFLREALASSLGKILTIALGLLLTLNFVRAINFTRVLYFPRLQETKNVFDYTDSLGANHIAMSGCLYGIFANYYQLTDHFRYRFKAESLDKERTLPEYDYLLISPPDSIESSKEYPTRIDTVKRFRKNNILLLRCKGNKFIYKKRWL